MGLCGGMKNGPHAPYCVWLLPSEGRFSSWSGPATKKPPEGGLAVLAGPVQALLSSNCCSSPDSYISIMMSEPPMNSPLTYSWGMVGHWL